MRGLLPPGRRVSVSIFTFVLVKRVNLGKLSIYLSTLSARRGLQLLAEQLDVHV
jgi:hypothetical protein